ncbi:MAG: carcinine hydrolase/isopenicillin-N N-acyltransferase family protein [Candidatus Paceibacterota bacterium]
MCTLGTKKINGHFYLFKNRDREYNIDTKIIKENGKAKKLLIVDQRGHCEGINEYGIGIIEATLQPYPRIKHQTPSPIARKILDQNNILTILEIIKKSKVSANMIISDGKSSFLVEKTPYQFAVTKVRTEGVLTNLSVKLNKKNGSKLKDVRDYASMRYKRAKEIIKEIKSLKDIPKFLRDKKNYPMSICSGKPWWITTKCSFIYDLKNKSIFFCKTRPDRGVFKEYKL